MSTLYKNWSKNTSVTGISSVNTSKCKSGWLIWIPVIHLLTKTSAKVWTSFMSLSLKLLYVHPLQATFMQKHSKGIKRKGGLGCLSSVTLIVSEEIWRSTCWTFADVPALSSWMILPRCRRAGWSSQMREEGWEETEDWDIFLKIKVV